VLVEKVVYTGTCVISLFFNLYLFIFGTVLGDWTLLTDENMGLKGISYSFPIKCKRFQGLT
jgi:hypothetical protein